MNNHRNTSYSIITFFVIETLEQYLKHGIVPPQSLPEIRKKYLKVTSNQKFETNASQQQKLSRTFNFWNKKVI